MSAKHIVNRTMLSIRDVCTFFKLQNLSQPWLRALRQSGGIHEHLKLAAPTVVKWMHPPTGRLKLNVDGAFKLSVGGAGGGGILRDHEGSCVFAFATNYQEVIFTLDAEARALRDGLTLCCRKGFLDIMVETDSHNLMQIVTGQMTRLWALTCIIHELAVITRKLKVQIKYVPLEAKQVAHSLAGHGCLAAHFNLWDSGADIPHAVKGPYRLDKVGCPTLRL
ncbi:hypothetical protein Taro_028780 [Colocasia esculenta]|uniref:RNase H type-1 domain-containing protein n=1 Tax=Colocasia esculenta TaxID=4460 RepID=A0A843VI55_COLES|nr:hypothetical protein [Colocasia esculenta]